MTASPKAFLWLLIVVTAAADMARTLPAGPTSQVLAFQWMLNAVILFGWCKAHARKLGVVEPTGSALLCGIVPPVGVPLYFYRTFGFKQGTVKTLKALGFLVLLIFVGVMFEKIGEHYAL